MTGEEERKNQVKRKSRTAAERILYEIQTEVAGQKLQQKRRGVVSCVCPRKHSVRLRRIPPI
jgi:hypothetical protein